MDEDQMCGQEAALDAPAGHGEGGAAGEVRGVDRDPLDGTLVVKLGYRGQGFAGLAEQPGQRTVAGELRGALETILRRHVTMEAAGRTDSGVHALGQYVSVPVTREELARSGRSLASGLVALTPDDLSIRGLYRARKGFSARFDARERHYCYRIACGSTRPVMAWDHAWWLRTAPSLDVMSMDAAALALVGEHDFRSFCKASSAQVLEADGRSTSRFLRGVVVRSQEEAGEPLVTVDVWGNAFLHNMVRIIVGSLVEVGRGNRPASWMAEALGARDRRAAGPTAPAEGLTFVDVTYPDWSMVAW